MAVSDKLRKRLEKRKAELKSNSGGLPFITFKEGTTRIRVLPVKEDEDFATEVTQFYLGDQIKGVVSPATFGEPCAIMEAYNTLKAGDDDDKKLADTFKPRRRYYAPAIRFSDEQGKTVDGEPKLALLTNSMYGELIEYLLDEEQGDFMDPDEGYDIKIKRSGTGQMDTEYKTIPCKPTKLPKEFRKKIFNPDEMVRELIPSYDTTKEYINQFLGLDDDDDDDDTPKSKGKRPAKSKKKVVSDVDAPAKKKKRKKS